MSFLAVAHLARRRTQGGFGGFADGLCDGFSYERRGLIVATNDFQVLYPFVVAHWGHEFAVRLRCRDPVWLVVLVFVVAVSLNDDCRGFERGRRR